jgi:hypothetical protein
MIRRGKSRSSGRTRRDEAEIAGIADRFMIRVGSTYILYSDPRSAIDGIGPGLQMRSTIPSRTC